MKMPCKLNSAVCVLPLLFMIILIADSGRPAAAQQSGATALPPVHVDVASRRPRAARGKPRIAAPRQQPMPVPADVNANRETARGPVHGYVATRSSTGSKTDTPILENPQSISVVTKDQIEAQGARSIAEALRYEAGVVSETRVGDRFDNVFVRGFGGFGGNANYLHFWDGLRLPKGVSYAMPSVDPYMLERVEILRGPASVLYGQNNLGGMVNLISKNPTPVSYHEIMTRFGDHNRIESGFDLGGPIDKNGEFSYRVVGLARKADTEVNYTTTERQLIAPTLTWRPTMDTTLTVRASYDHDPSSYQPNWLPAVGTLQTNPNGQIPKSFFVGNPYYNKYNREQTTAGYEFEHHFNDVFTVRQNFRYMDVSSDFKALSSSNYVAGANCGIATSNACIARTSTHFIEHLTAATIDNQAEAKFVTGWLQHTVLAGLDYQTASASALSGNGPNSYVNYLNPVYAPIPEPALTTQANQDRKQLGVYGQEQIRLGKLAVSLGIRNDWADATSLSRTISSGATVRTQPSDSAMTYRAGATYLFDSGFAPYVSYATSFEPTLGNDYTGKPFVPTTGQQYEVGLKYQPVGVNAMFMLSYYDLTQQNVLTSDTAHLSGSFPLCTGGPGTTYCQIQVGEVHSKGLELSAKATLREGLNLIASYTHTDIVISKSTQIVTPPGVALQGKVPVGTPSNTAALWLDYTHQSGPLAGFGYGGGVRYVGTSFGDNINSAAMVVPAFTLADATIHYDLAGASPQLKGWKLAVNMANIFDKRYVSACNSATQCFYGNGRSTLGSLKFQW